MPQSDQLPNDTALHILSFLTVNDWCILRLVCKNDKNCSLFSEEVLGDDLLWRTVFNLAVEHVKYDPIRSQVLNEVKHVDNCRQKLILLRKAFAQYMSRIDQQRLDKIRELEAARLKCKHVYYSLDELRHMFFGKKKIDVQKVFGPYDIGVSGL